ncbi:MAG: IS3 family transposase [Chloroflexi bacterium]|nr:IS3 family transposase [Chloroflexota bacterium]
MPKHGYRRTTEELNRLGWGINGKKVRRMMHAM